MAFLYITSASRVLRRISMASWLLLVIVGSNACRKNQPSGETPSVLQVFNGMDDGLALVTIYDEARPKSFITSRKLEGNGEFIIVNNVYYTNNTNQPLQVYAWPDTLAHQAPILDLQLDLQPNSIYSLFFSGSKAKPSCLIHKEQLPVLNPADSVMSLRFVNLTDIPSITVNLQGAAAGSHIPALTGQGIAEFVPFSAQRMAGPYVFEIRDKATDAVLTTYRIEKSEAPRPNNDFTNKWLNTAHTLVLTGKQGGTGRNMPKISLIRHR